MFIIANKILVQVWRFVNLLLGIPLKLILAVSGNPSAIFPSMTMRFQSTIFAEPSL